MHKEYSILQSEEFSAAREQLGQLLNGLQSAAMVKKEHGEVERFLLKEGTKFLNLLQQAHFDTRSKNESMLDAVTGVDGIVRNHRRKDRKRRLMTLLGEVTVTRLCYGKKGETSLFPLDKELNLPADTYSHGLRERVARESAMCSFDQTVQKIKETTGGSVPKHQVEELTVRAAQDFERFYEERTGQAVEPTDDLLVLSIDGKGIVMRPEGLRESTRQASEREQHKLKTRLSRGEKRNRKRMATVTAVYDVAKHERTPESIMKLEEASSKKPRLRKKRVWASVDRDAVTVTRELFEEARRRDPKNERPWVILADGQKQQLKNLCAEIRSRKLKNVTIVLDFIHVLEYLWKAAFCFFAEGSEAAERWVAEKALSTLQGKASFIAAGMRRAAKKLSDADRKLVDKCADYLLKNAYLLRYGKFLDQGYPIATGVIEGACRHLIKDRLDITGARWGLQGAKPSSSSGL